VWLASVTVAVRCRSEEDEHNDYPKYEQDIEAAQSRDATTVEIPSPASSVLFEAVVVMVMVIMTIRGQCFGSRFFFSLPFRRLIHIIVGWWCVHCRGILSCLEQ
jgi:hypothetical protein